MVPDLNAGHNGHDEENCVNAMLGEVLNIVRIHRDLGAVSQYFSGMKVVIECIMMKFTSEAVRVCQPGSAATWISLKLCNSIKRERDRAYCLWLWLEMDEETAQLHKLETGDIFEQQKKRAEKRRISVARKSKRA